MRKVLVHLAWTSICVTSPAFAEGRISTLHDVAVIDDGQGAARVLFRAGGLESLGNVAISRATLTVAVDGSPAERALELWIHPVTRTWNPATVTWDRGWSRPGGDFDDELVSIARLDLRTPAAELTFDVTGLVKEIVESGIEADGFILTVAPEDGIGIRMEDLPRFGDLAGTEIKVNYRKMPPAPDRRGSRS